MSTQPNTDNNDLIPKILERNDVIILSDSLECPCGRLKQRVHCPSCGKTKLYASAQTEPVKLPDSVDVMKGCKSYRCESCGERFNDIDWYFNCHAAKRIDWAATKRLAEQQKAEAKLAKQQDWMLRIETGEKFDFNARTKCKAECGFDPEEMRILMQRAKTYKKPTHNNQEAFENHVVSCSTCNTLPPGQFCAEAEKLRSQQ